MAPVSDRSVAAGLRTGRAWVAAGLRTGRWLSIGHNAPNLLVSRLCMLLAEPIPP